MKQNWLCTKMWNILFKQFIYLSISNVGTQLHLAKAFNVASIIITKKYH